MIASVTGSLSNPSGNSPFVLQPVILAGDANGTPPDSPDQRIDPNTITSPFAGVGSVAVSLPGTGDFLGSGTAISRRHILTAAHLFDLVEDDGVNDVQPGNVVFNLNFGRILSDRITAEAIQLFPGFQGFDDTVSNDLAIITLSQDLPEGVPIYALNRQPLTTGTMITLVGYGTSGDGVSGQIAGTASFDQKRVGQNQVDLVMEGAFVYDFDGADASTNLFSALGSGASLGNTIEATVGPGDSGGPSFIRSGDTLLLTGVNTFAFGLPDGFGLPGAVQGVFGTGGGGVIISEADKLTWIDGVLATLPGVGNITGTAWQDLNGDGQQTVDEPGLTGWTIYLDVNQDSQLSPTDPTAITDASGNYGFTNVATGSYSVAQVLQPQFQQTFPSNLSGGNGTHSITVESGKTVIGLNFGNRAIATPTPTPTPSPTPSPTPTSISGTEADDTLIGTVNDDLITANSGNDVLSGLEGNDRLYGDAGLDRLLGGAGDDSLNGGDDADRLLGDDGADSLNGDAGNDVLFGDADADPLNGGSGDDVLVGGAEGDRLTGGDGRDRILYTSVQDGGDRILDFDLTDDVIVLKRIFDRPEFSSSDPLTDYVNLTQVGAKTVVKIDPDGDSGSSLFVRLAVLENIIASDLKASNFLV